MSMSVIRNDGQCLAVSVDGLLIILLPHSLVTLILQVLCPGSVLSRLPADDQRQRPDRQNNDGNCDASSFHKVEVEATVLSPFCHPLTSALAWLWRSASARSWPESS